MFTFSQDRLKEKGRVACNLKQEVSIIQSALAGDVELNWIKDLMMSNLQAELDWQVDTESALEKCGVNCKISTNGKLLHWSSITKNLMGQIYS